MDDISGEEFPDWEILPNCELSLPPPAETQNNGSSRFTDNDSRGAIKPQYFSSHPTLKFEEVKQEVVENSSVVSSECVDPCLESCFRERVVETGDSEDETPEKSSDSCDSVIAEPEKMDDEVGEDQNEEITDGGVEEGEVSVVEGATSKERAWWEVPLKYIRVFVSRSIPFWSLSLGVVAMGVLLLWRKRYKAKRKDRGLPIKVCVEDKQKVSQFMVQAARLNEAFSVVRRVPVIRSSLLPAGASPWPVIGLR